MTSVDAAAIAVVGSDAIPTAAAALDLARAEARQRPVTVVDLIGDAPPLRQVVLTDDSHGVADCLAYGVSFAAVSRPTTADPHVSVIPSGSDPLIDADVLGSRRWERLIAQARDRGTLLVFAALSDTPGLDALTSQVDRVVPDTAVAGQIARATQPAGEAAPTVHRFVPPRIVRPSALPSNRRALGAGGVALGVLAFAVIAWFVARPTRRADGITDARTAAARTDTLTSTAQLANGASAHRASGTSAMTPADPEDSTAAAAFAVEIGHYPTYVGALRVLREQVKRGAATITPLPDPGGIAPSTDPGSPPLMFVVYVGAGRSAAAVDSMRRLWAASRDFPGGSLAHTPYALRLTGRISADSALRATVAWRARGIPAYALDDGGSGTVYAGAFATLDQAALLTTRLHAVGLTPIPAYRVGQAP